jgi:hypothetical protein
MSNANSKLMDSVSSVVNARPNVEDSGNVGGYFFIQAHRNGELLWTEEGANIITNEGLTYLNGVALTAVTQKTAWYLALFQDAGDAAGTLPTFSAAMTYDVPVETEVTAYDETPRQTWTGVAGSAGVSTNSAAPAVFTISTNSTYVSGVALMSVNTKGDHTGGAGNYFFSGKAFAAVRTLQDNDTITITYSITNTSS